VGLKVVRGLFGFGRVHLVFDRVDWIGQVGRAGCWLLVEGLRIGWLGVYANIRKEQGR
jgi:hypothetical protein